MYVLLFAHCALVGAVVAAAGRSAAEEVTPDDLVGTAFLDGNRHSLILGSRRGTPTLLPARNGKLDDRPAASG